MTEIHSTGHTVMALQLLESTPVSWTSARMFRRCGGIDNKKMALYTSTKPFPVPPLGIEPKFKV